MSPLPLTLLTNFIVIALAMIALWVVCVTRRDVSLVDPFWGAGFVSVTWISWLLNSPSGFRVVLLNGLVTAWGARLAVFLLWRNWGQPEDRRYAAMRARNGNRFVTVKWLSANYPS